MSSEDAASRPEDQPLDDVPEEPTSESADAYAFGTPPWADDFADPFADPTSNLFSAELENVNASDWDVDASRIWGDDGTQGDSSGGIGIDFPL